MESQTLDARIVRARAYLHLARLVEVPVSVSSFAEEHQLRRSKKKRTSEDRGVVDLIADWRRLSGNECPLDDARKGGQLSGGSGAGRGGRQAGRPASCAKMRSQIARCAFLQ